MTLRWSPRLAMTFALISIGLHTGFYLSTYKGYFFRLIGSTEYVPMAIASWTVSKVFPACFPTLRQAILFEALLPILAGIEGFVIGWCFDTIVSFRDRKTLAG